MYTDQLLYPNTNINKNMEKQLQNKKSLKNMSKFLKVAAKPSRVQFVLIMLKQ